MAQPAVRVEGLGKRYLVPGAGAAPLDSRPQSGSSLRRWLRRRPADERDWFWALRETSFEVERGEVLGIIGRNGAGKSTLLKLLAGVVAPTTGRAILNGRVGSLLEVGTGFHPDFSGRENVLLSAALLGIPKYEVLRQFDAIVDYAGVGGFIDMPVKRYSSGMYMRLAYSVSALLQPDILLLDEVLAVGDAEFQKKTRRNVDTIAHDGRTVLFVSHSMSSIISICTRCIWIDRGRVVHVGAPQEIVDRYLQAVGTTGNVAAPVDLATAPPRVELSEFIGYHSVVREEPAIQWIETCGRDGRPARVFQTGEPMHIRLGINCPWGDCDFVSIGFHTLDDRRVTAVFSNFGKEPIRVPARGVVECRVAELHLPSGDYSLQVEAGQIRNGRVLCRDSVADATQVRVSLGGYLGYPGLLSNQGYLAQQSRWVCHSPVDLHA